MYNAEIFEIILKDLESGVLNLEESIIDNIRENFTCSRNEALSHLAKLKSKKLIKKHSDKFNIEGIDKKVIGYTITDEGRVALAEKKFIKNTKKANGDPPTKTWQIIGVVVAIILFIIAFFLRA